MHERALRGGRSGQRACPPRRPAVEGVLAPHHSQERRQLSSMYSLLRVPAGRVQPPSGAGRLSGRRPGRDDRAAAAAARQRARRGLRGARACVPRPRRRPQPQHFLQDCLHALCIKAGFFSPAGQQQVATAGRGGGRRQRVSPASQRAGAAARLLPGCCRAAPQAFAFAGVAAQAATEQAATEQRQQGGRRAGHSHSPMTAHSSHLS